MPSKKFTYSFKQGSIGEDLVASLLRNVDKNVVTKVSKAERKFYDISFTFENKNLYAEVKYDIYAKKSGNMAIEVHNPVSGQDSGLSITKANFWIHVFDEPSSVWITTVKKLKQFVKDNKPDRIVERAGDGNAKILLYKKHRLLSVIFIEITKDNIKSVISQLRQEECIV